MKTIPAGQFKAQCLALLDDVAQKNEAIVVTKYGKPVARIVPYIAPGPKDNPLKGSIVFQDDIISPTGETWEATR